MRRRNTPTTLEILDILRESGHALSQDMIVEQMELKADRVTVYRILNRFCEDGVVHKVVAEDGKSYFAICQNCEKHLHHHDHFHFKCTVCAQIECLNQAIELTLPKGYTISEMNCIVSGVCSKCQQSV